MAERSMKSHQRTRSQTSVWLTPPEIIRALGTFYLDPCACAEPRPWRTAVHHYAPPEDGLALPWQGIVWCNPPFGSAADPWLEKAAAHGNAIVLVPAATETDRWFRFVWGRAGAVLFLRGRPHFHRPDGSRAAANSGCSIALIGYGVEASHRLWRSDLGSVVCLIDPPSSKMAAD